MGYTVGLGPSLNVLSACNSRRPERRVLVYPDSDGGGGGGVHLKVKGVYCDVVVGKRGLIFNLCKVCVIDSQSTKRV